MDGLAQAPGGRVQQPVGEDARQILQHLGRKLAALQPLMGLAERSAADVLAAFAPLLQPATMVVVAEPLGEALGFFLDDGFGHDGLFGADLAVVLALGGEVVEGVEKHIVESGDLGVDVARYAEIDHQHGAMLASPQGLAHRGQVNERIRAGRAGDQDIRLRQMGFQIGQPDAEAPDALGQRHGAAHIAIGDDDASDALGVQVPGAQADHLAGADQERGMVVKIGEDAPREVGCDGGDRYRLRADEGIGPDPLGGGEAAGEQSIQSMPDMAVLERERVGLLELAQDLGLADHHGVEARRDAQQVAHHGVAGEPVKTAVEFGARHVPIAAQPVDDGRVIIGSEVDFGAVAGGQQYQLLHGGLRTQIGQRPRHIACGIGNAFTHRHGGGGVIESDAEKGHCGARGERELRFCVKRSSQDKNRVGGAALGRHAIVHRFVDVDGYEAASGVNISGWPRYAGFALLPLLCACVPGAPVRDRVPSPPRPVADLAERSPTYWALTGERLLRENNPAEAARAYARAAALTDDVDLLQRGAQAALAAGDLTLAADLADRWHRQDPAALPPLQIRFSAALTAGDLAAAGGALAQLVAAQPDGEAEALLDLPAVLAEEVRDRPARLALLDPLARQYAGWAEFHYADARLALLAGDLDRAQRSIVRTRELAPNWYQAQALAAQIQIRQGHTEAGLAQLRAVVRKHGDDQALRLDEARVLLQLGRLEEATQSFEAILKAAPNQPEALYALGLLKMQEGDDDAALEHLSRLAASGNRSMDAYYYLGILERRRGRLQNALQWLSQVSGGSHVIQAQLLIAETLGDLGRMEAGRAHLAQLRERNPSLAPALYQGEGEWLYRAGVPDQSAAVFTEALNRYPDNRDLRYWRSLAAEQAGNLDLAEADLRSLIASKPEDALVLNALGYFLAVHTDRLQEAEDLVRRALARDPDNPAMLDSLGWVYFRQGDLDAADRYLVQAYERLNDPEVAAHLGELRWRQGRRGEAREIWQKARDAFADHPVLRQTLRRYGEE